VEILAVETRAAVTPEVVILEVVMTTTTTMPAGARPANTRIVARHRGVLRATTS